MRCYIICTCLRLTLQSPNGSLLSLGSLFPLHANSGLPGETHHTSRALIPLNNRRRQAQPLSVTSLARVCQSGNENAG